MLDSSENTHWSRWQTIECPQCGCICGRQDRVCGQCNRALAVEERAVTARLRRSPLALPGHRLGSDRLTPDAPVTLQFLPSGICLTFGLKTPMIIGRSPGDEHDFLDLTSLKAAQHGVSRRHCSLRRDGANLIVTDIASTNGTSVNGEALIPFRDYVIHDGDRLILGTLHVTVHFVTAVGAQ